MIARPIAELPEVEDGQFMTFLKQGRSPQTLKWVEDLKEWQCTEGYGYYAENFTHFAPAPIMPVDHPLGHLTPENCTPEQFKEFWESLGWEADEFFANYKKQGKQFMVNGYTNKPAWIVGVDFMLATMVDTLSEAATTAEALAQVLGGWK